LEEDNGVIADYAGLLAGRLYYELIVVGQETTGVRKKLDSF
jgi:hypothetical protein